MRDFGKVYGTFWTSETTRSLSDQGKVLALYLLTGPHANMIGCFRLPDGYVEEDVGWKSVTVSKGFAELFRNGFATRDEASKWVYLPAFLKWNPIENPNQGKAAGRLFEQIPKTVCFKSLVARKLADQNGKVPSYILEPFLKGFGTVLEPFWNQEQEQEKEKEKEKEKIKTGKPAPRAVFVPPTVEEVRAYVATRQKKIDPEEFVDYYTANGWVQGSKGKPVVNWKACVHTWEKRNFGTARQPADDDEIRAQRLKEQTRRRLDEIAREQSRTHSDNGQPEE